MSALSTKNIFKAFDGIKAVNDLSLSFEKGKITSLIGPNGSGKSTVVNLLTGVKQIDEGKVMVGNTTIGHVLKTYRAAKYGIARTFQNIRVFEQMSVLDNILVALTERSLWRALFESHNELHLEKAEKILKRVELFEKKTAMANELSYGQRKLLEIARIMAMSERVENEADVLFFDEPFAGLFPEMMKLVSEILKELRAAGKAVVLIEHNMQIIRELSDFIYVIDAGKHLFQGKPEEVLENKEVIEAYLGY